MADKNDVDALANYIRTINGNNKMGAGELAEYIIDYMKATPPADADLADRLDDCAALIDADMVDEAASYIADIKRAAAALRARAVPDVAAFRAMMFRLTELLDEDQFAEIERLAIDALASPPSAVPGGLALVPVEPTTDQLIAGAKVMFGRIRPSAGHGVIGDMYAAMLAASKAGDGKGGAE